MPDLVFSTKGQEGVLRAQDDMRKRAQDLQAELKRTEKDADKARAALLKIYESTKTPHEKLKEQMDQLRKAIKDGTAPPEALTALERLKAKQQETYSAARKEITKSTLSLKELEAAQKKTFDVGMVGKWGAAIGGAVSAAIIASFKTIKDEQAKLSSDAKASIVNEGSLAQLAKTPEEFKSLLAESRGMYAAGVGRDRNEAADTLFSLINAGVTDRGDRAFFARMRSAGLVKDAGAMGGAAAALQFNLGGNIQDIVNAGFGAGAYSPGSIEQLLIGAARGGTGAKNLGIGPDELIGATAVLSTARKSESEGGTLIAALLKALDVAGGFEGKTLDQSLQEIKARVAKGENLRGDSLLGGRAEAVDAYRILTGDKAGVFAEATAASRQGTASNAGANKLAIAETADPDLRAARLALQAEAKRNIDQIAEGSYASLYEGQLTERHKWADSLPHGIRQGVRGAQWLQETLYDPLIETKALVNTRATGTVPQLEGEPDTRTAFQKEQDAIIASLNEQRKSAEAAAARQEKLLEDQTRALRNIDNKTGDSGLPVSGD